MNMDANISRCAPVIKAERLIKIDKRNEQTFLRVIKIILW